MATSRPPRRPSSRPAASPATPARSLPMVQAGGDRSEPWDEGASLLRVASVRVDEGGRLLEVDVGDAVYRRGELVTVELDSGRAIAEVVSLPRRILSRGRFPRALRRATDEDVRYEAALRQREQQLFRQAGEVVRALDLPAKVVRVAVLRSTHRVIVYLGGEERFDVRELLRRLGPLVQARIELRQVGLRDAAKALGGVGPCGLQLCCNTFLSDFAPVSIKMAKDQGLPLAPQRVSGVCGRLLCCLVYEEAFYRQQRAALPRVGKSVLTPAGAGVVRDVDVLGGTLGVSIAGGPIQRFAQADVTLTGEPSRPPGTTAPRRSPRG